MPTLATMLQEIWKQDGHWILSYSTGRNEYAMEHTTSDMIIHAPSIEEVVRTTWMHYFGGVRLRTEGNTL